MDNQHPSTFTGEGSTTKWGDSIKLKKGGNYINRELEILKYFYIKKRMNSKQIGKLLNLSEHQKTIYWNLKSI